MWSTKTRHVELTHNQIYLQKQIELMDLSEQALPRINNKWESNPFEMYKKSQDRPMVTNFIKKNISKAAKYNIPKKQIGCSCCQTDKCLLKNSDINQYALES